MNVVILGRKTHRKHYVGWDMAGGYGLATSVGPSWRARLIEWGKSSAINVPSLSAAYLAAIFHNEGHSVSVDEKDLSRADLVLIPSSIVNFREEIGFAQELKNRYRLTLGFYGPFSSFVPEPYLEVADFVIQGEPEDGAMRIAKGMTPQGKVVSQRVTPLDQLPFPKWDIFDTSQFRFSPSRRRPFFPVLTSRGCSFGCNYCPYKAAIPDTRFREIEHVIEEIRYLKKDFGVQGILFRDPIFSINKNRTGHFAQRLIEEKFDLKWSCETRVDCLSFPLVDLLRESGLCHIGIGVETVNEPEMKRLKRGIITQDRQREMIRYCESQGITILANYTFGYPNDTRETIRQTVEYAKSLNTTFANFFLVTPYPGTEYYEQVKGDIVVNEWEKFDTCHMVLRHQYLKPEEFERLREKTFLEYYYRPKWILKYLRWKWSRDFENGENGFHREALEPQTTAESV